MDEYPMDILSIMDGFADRKSVYLAQYYNMQLATMKANIKSEVVPPPDLSEFVYDEKYAYYYDSVSNLYYDSNEQYFYNPQPRKIWL